MLSKTVDLPAVEPEAPLGKEGEQKPASEPSSDREAESEPEPIICRTETGRQFSQVVVQLESDFQGTFAQQFVDLHAGETVCLIFSHGHEDFSQPEVIDEARLSARPLKISLRVLEDKSQDGTLSTITIDNSRDESIALYIARAGKVPDLLFFEESALVIPARSQVVRRYARVLPRAVFAYFSSQRLAPSPSESLNESEQQSQSAPPPTYGEEGGTPLLSNQAPGNAGPSPRQAPNSEIPLPGVRGALDVYGLGGTIFNHSPELEEEALGNGFSSLPHRQELIGFGFGLTIERVRFAWDILASFGRVVESETGGEEAKLNQTIIALAGGYDVFRHGGFSIAPLVGVGFGDIRVRTHPDNPMILPAQVSAYYNNETVLRRNVYSVRGELAVQHLLPLGSSGDKLGFLLGGRIGYQQQFTQTKWLPDEGDKNAPELFGGPKVDASGLYLHFVIGMSTYLL